MRLQLVVCALFIATFAHAESDSGGSNTAGLYGLVGVVPGLGHAINGDFREGGGWALGVIGTSIVGGSMETSKHPSGGDFLLHSATDAWFYSIYDAYKGAGEFKKPFAKISGWENYLAAYDVRFMAQPSVYIPVGLTSLVLLANQVYDEPDKRPSSIFGKKFNTDGLGQTAAFGAAWGYHSFTGWGEEALFRGYLQHELSRWLTPWIGIPVTSAIFGLAHTQYGGAGRIYVSSLGAYMGIMAHVNDYDLRSMIFLHTVYDAILTVGMWRAGQPVGFNLAIPTMRF